MFKFVVVLAIATAATAAPGYLGGYAGLPPATSYTSRVDVHSRPIPIAYSTPLLSKTLIASPLSYSAASPLISSYGYSGLGHGLGYSTGLGAIGYGGIGHHGYYGGIGHHGYGYSSIHGY